MDYDVAIVGAGVMGLSTAYALLRRGVKRVVVLEQFKVGHDRAASTDSSKAIRYEYGEESLYSRMVAVSIPLWQQLERETGEDLYVNCGVVCWGRGDAPHARASYLTVRELGVPIREVTPDQLCVEYPQFAVADMSYATINPHGGFLRSLQCVRALAKRVRELGGVVLEDYPAAAFEDNGGSLLLGHGERQIRARKLVYAAGPWMANLFPTLGVGAPLTANRQQVVYTRGAGPEFEPGPFPVYLNLDHDFYGFPLDSEGFLKSSIHLPGQVVDPDVPFLPDEEFSNYVKSLQERYMPSTSRGTIAKARVCMYAMTPDEDFMIDTLPARTEVVILAGFSGHGFKFGPLIGQLAASLVLGEEPDFPLDAFALSRFSI